MGASAPPLLHRGAISSAICLALVSGCVLPVGPEFQDPPATQNYAPLILGSDPDLGRRVTTPDFRVTVQDPNVGDDIFVRFVADYPPLSGNTRFLADRQVHHSPDGRLLAEDVSVPPITCSALAKLPSHQITVIVADRKFLFDDASAMQPADPLPLPADAKSVRASWTLDMECK